MTRNFYEDEQLDGHDNANQTAPYQTVNGVLMTSPPQVEARVKSVRLALYSVYSSAVDYVNHGYTKYNKTERQITDTVSELHDKNEDLFPNSAYILIGGLTGTVFARQRSILAKITFPLVLGMASFKYFLPQTFTSTLNFVWKWEKTRLPELANQQQLLVQRSEDLVSNIEHTGVEGSKKLGHWLESLSYNIKKYSGLNIDQDATKK